MMARALWVLARPKLLPFVLALVLAGFGWTHWDRALVGRGGEHLLWVLAGWALLHAGTLWLNAALDEDEGEVLFGEAVAPPPGIERWAYAALAGAVLLATIGGPVSGGACAVCALLSVAYSHPATVWKGHPIGGPMVNWVGYGLLSPLAGWAAVEVPANPRSVAVWLLASLGVLGTYFTAQAFQGAEDEARGYRTLVVTHGPAATLHTARILIGIGLVGGLCLAIVGWLPRICLAGAPAWWVTDRWLVTWAQQPNGGSEAWARGLARRLLWTGLLGLVLAFADYVRDSFAGVPVAGLGTASGHPVDRPRLPPNDLVRWERRVGGVVLDEP